MVSARLRVYVTPKAGADAIAGWRDDELRVKVTVAPEGGKANAAACELVARSLGVPKSAVRVVSGAAARHKTLEIEGASDEDVRTAFPE